MSIRRITYFLGIAFLLTMIVGIPVKSQFETQSEIANPSSVVVDRNVNVISGTKLPWGDPWLQRQNEPSIAVSSRAAWTLLGGGNDYRTVDMPIEGETIPGHQIEEGVQAAARDAWLGVYKSFDGGQSWVTTLLPGYPQDPKWNVLKKYTAAADATVRAGTNGLFFYSGMAFDRDIARKNAIFVARFIDNNNHEISTLDVINNPDLDPIEYIDTKIIDRGNDRWFLDMPNMAVGIPNSMSGMEVMQTQCAYPQNIPNNNVYVAYTAFRELRNGETRSHIRFKRSMNSGHFWSFPRIISKTHRLVQRPIIAIDPSDSRKIYVVWRRFKQGAQGDGIFIAKSTNSGLTFTWPRKISNLEEFDQGTSGVSFRTNSYPAITVDLHGRVYVAVARRMGGITGKARIYVKTSGNGLNWSSPWKPLTQNDYGVQGHQIQPVLHFQEGFVFATWIDQREDLAYKEIGQSALNEWIEDSQYRHTVDVRFAFANPGANPVFNESKKVSRYLHLFETDGNGNPILDANGKFILKQVQWNPPNLPMFQGGLVPFHGDWIDMMGQFILPQPNGSWRYNTYPTIDTKGNPEMPNIHIAWTDNRDVWYPFNSQSSQYDWWGDWTAYAPVNSAQSAEFQQFNNCLDYRNAGSRNQNIYTASVSEGLVVGSYGNAKPLDDMGSLPEGGKIPRAFVVTVKNMTDAFRSYLLTFDAPSNVEASFDQFDSLDELIVPIDPHSTVSVPVYLILTGSASNAFNYETVTVSVTEVTSGVADPQYGDITLNPDHTNPPIEDSVANPNIRSEEVYSPNIRSPNIRSSSESGPITTSPDVERPEDINPDTVDPNSADNYVNPNIRSPNIRSTAPEGEWTLTDTSWEVTNEGNTTASYYFKVNTDYQYPNTTEPGEPGYVDPDEAVEFQLLVYRVHKTPVAMSNCALGEEEHHELIANIANPNIRSPNIRSPNIRSSTVAGMRIQQTVLDAATVALPPGESALFILRALDPVPSNDDTFDPGTENDPKVGAAVVSFASNTQDAVMYGEDVPPPVSTTFSEPGENPLDITTSGLPDAIYGVDYSYSMLAFGTPPFQWTASNLPSGLDISTDGIITGAPLPSHNIYPVTYNVDFYVTDSTQTTVSETIPLRVVLPLEITNDVVPDATVGVPYAETLNAVGGIGGYTWSFVGTPPSWLTLDPISGVLTATPSASDASQVPYDFIVQVMDGSAPPLTATRNLSITVIAGGTTSPPILVSPDDGADDLDNGCVDGNDPIQWSFDWEPVQGAFQYNLYVIHEGPPASQTPLLDVDIPAGTSDNSFYNYLGDGYIAEQNRTNWTWKVRADMGHAVWTEFSEIRSFDVEPVNSDCTQLPPGDGLVAHFPLNQNADDASGNGYDGTIVSYEAFPFGDDRLGNSGGAFTAIVNTDHIYVDLSNQTSSDFDFGTGDFSFAAWINMSSNIDNSDPMHIMGKRVPSSTAPGTWARIFALDGNIRFEFSPTEVVVSPSVNYRDDEWHHVAGTRENGTATLYIDGLPVASQTQTTIVNVTNTADFTIGKWSFEDSFMGMIDDVRVYNRALSNIEIAGLHSLNTGLVVYFPFSEDLNGDTIDESGHGFLGTPTGALQTTDIFNIADSAFSFDGTDDIITIPYADILDVGQNMTVTAWAYPTSATKTQDIVLRSGHTGGTTGNPDGDPNPYGLSLSSEGDVIFSLGFYIDDIPYRYEVRQSGYNINEWSLVVGTYDGTTMRLFINGALVGSTDVTGLLADAVNSLMLIGSRTQQVANTFQGKLDEIRVYSRTLTSDEVLTLYKIVK